MDLTKLTLDNFTNTDVQTLRTMMLQLLKNEDELGSVESNTNIRERGCTITVTYERKGIVSIDGRGSSNMYANITLKAPLQLWGVLAKLFDVGDDDFDALRDEYRAAL